MAKKRVIWKEQPEGVQQVHRLLLKAERHAIHAWMLMHGVRPGTEAGRLWYRWIKRGVHRAVETFGKPTNAEVTSFIVAEIKRDLARPEPRP